MINQINIYGQNALNSVWHIGISITYYLSYHYYNHFTWLLKTPNKMIHGKCFKIYDCYTNKRNADKIILVMVLSVENYRKTKTKNPTKTGLTCKDIYSFP